MATISESSLRKIIQEETKRAKKETSTTEKFRSKLEAEGVVDPKIQERILRKALAQSEKASKTQNSMMFSLAKTFTSGLLKTQQSFVSSMTKQINTGFITKVGNYFKTQYSLFAGIVTTKLNKIFGESLEYLQAISKSIMVTFNTLFGGIITKIKDKFTHLFGISDATGKEQKKTNGLLQKILDHFTLDAKEKKRQIKKEGKGNFPWTAFFAGTFVGLVNSVYNVVGKVLDWVNIRTYSFQRWLKNTWIFKQIKNVFTILGGIIKILFTLPALLLIEMERMFGSGGLISLLRRAYSSVFLFFDSIVQVFKTTQGGLQARMTGVLHHLVKIIFNPVDGFVIKAVRTIFSPGPIINFVTGMLTRIAGGATTSAGSKLISWLFIIFKPLGAVFSAFAAGIKAVPIINSILSIFVGFYNAFKVFDKGGSIWDSLATGIIEGLAYFTAAEFFEMIFNWIFGTNINIVRPLIDGLIALFTKPVESITKGLDWMVKYFWEWAESLISGIPQAISNWLMDSPFGDIEIFGTFTEEIKDVLMIIPMIVQDFAFMFYEIWDSIKGLFGGEGLEIWKYVKESLSGLWEVFKALFKIGAFLLILPLKGAVIGLLLFIKGVKAVIKFFGDLSDSFKKSWFYKTFFAEKGPKTAAERTQQQNVENSVLEGQLTGDTGGWGNGYASGGVVTKSGKAIIHSGEVIAPIRKLGEAVFLGMKEFFKKEHEIFSDAIADGMVKFFIASEQVAKITGGSFGGFGSSFGGSSGSSSSGGGKGTSNGYPLGSKIKSNLQSGVAGRTTGEMYSGFGSVAMEMESGSKMGNPGTVSSGKGDPGGVSYGSFQIATRTGTMANFLKSKQGAPYASRLRAAGAPGSAGFSAEWKKIAQENPQAFGEAQKSFITETHYNPVLNANQGLAGRGPAIQEMMLSTGTQYGPGLGPKVIKGALAGKDLSKMSDAEIINTVQDYKAANVNRHFSQAPGTTRQSVANRHNIKERNALLALANTPMDKLSDSKVNSIQQTEKQMSQQKSKQEEQRQQALIDSSRMIDESILDLGKSQADMASSIMNSSAQNSSVQNVSQAEDSSSDYAGSLALLMQNSIFV